LTGTTASILIATIGARQPPHVVWNASASVPIGLYRVLPQPVTRGDIAVIRLPPALAAFAAGRAYLADRAYLLKPIVAVAGDRVCRIGIRVTVNGGAVARAQKFDGGGRAMPRWQGCRKLRAGQSFVLAARPDSFDGRYFGPLMFDTIVGRAEPLWTFKD
jgi:conjugative transfer signal peptidase TraF